MRGKRPPPLLHPSSFFFFFIRNENTHAGKILFLFPTESPPSQKLNLYPLSNTLCFCEIYFIIFYPKWELPTVHSSKKQISVNSVGSINGHIYILYRTIFFAEKNEHFRLHLYVIHYLYSFNDFSCPYCFWFFFNTILIVIHFQVPALPLLSLPWGISCSLRYS